MFSMEDKCFHSSAVCFSLYLYTPGIFLTHVRIITSLSL